MPPKIVVAVLALLAAVPVRAAEPPPGFTTALDRDQAAVGRIWQPASKRYLSPDELAALATEADVVLLGETHDNPDHHALQAWLLRRLIAAGRRPSVAFEMIDETQAPTLTGHLAAHPGDAAGLGPALKWQNSGWPDWAHYRPIAEAALAAGMPLLPANLGRDATRAAAKAGAPGLEPAVAAAMAAEIKDSHCGMLPDKAVPAMVAVQWARDAAMAKSLAAGLERQGSAVLIAGSGHVRRDRAVPRHLGGRRILAVAFVEVRPGMVSPAEEDLPFDAVWFTPRAERSDPCEAFAQHMKGKGSP
ncbi:MAG: ChaN family lipoprotein [Magnetospirillum sp.]|nr:ChaN family lipoprotein [Magnetospirillum sp.]